MELSEEDIKLIKYEKRWGYIFSLLIISAGGLLNLFLFATNANENWFTLTIALVDIGIILLSACIVYCMNKKYNSDLKANTKTFKIEKVQCKETSYKKVIENIPSELWEQVAKKCATFHLTINGYRYNVDQDIYEKIKEEDPVEMYYSACSNTLLEIKKRRFTV